MNQKTLQHLKVTEHIKYNSGTKTVCVSTCLSFFGIEPHTYNFTSSDSNLFAYDNVLRRNGLGVRSRMSEFKIKKGVSSMTFLLSNIKSSNYTEKDYFIVSGIQSKCAHLMVVNGLGEVVIDTAPKKRWRVRRVKQIIYLK